MSKQYSGALLALFVFFNSCTNGQTKPTGKSLSATEFAEKIKTLPGASVIDVRTAGEFSTGHLQKAVNIDLNGNEFEKQIATLDKSKPVFVYCLSGTRSAAAANKMRSIGFREVYELEKGILKWRAANLPETTDNIIKSAGMTRQQFDAMLNSDKLVLIDFYADWCAPCKLMEPYLKEISKDMADKVVVFRINTEDNPGLCKDLKIDELPVLQLYKNKTLTWTNTGFIEKETVLKHLY